MAEWYCYPTILLNFFVVGGGTAQKPVPCSHPTDHRPNRMCDSVSVCCRFESFPVISICIRPKNGENGKCYSIFSIYFYRCKILSVTFVNNFSARNVAAWIRWHIFMCTQTGTFNGNFHVNGKLYLLTFCDKAKVMGYTAANIFGGAGTLLMNVFPFFFHQRKPLSTQTFTSTDVTGEKNDKNRTIFSHPTIFRQMNFTRKLCAHATQPIRTHSSCNHFVCITTAIAHFTTVTNNFSSSTWTNTKSEQLTCQSIYPFDQKVVYCLLSSTCIDC